MNERRYEKERVTKRMGKVNVPDGGRSRSRKLSQVTTGANAKEQNNQQHTLRMSRFYPIQDFQGRGPDLGSESWELKDEAIEAHLARIMGHLH